MSVNKTVFGEEFNESKVNQWLKIAAEFVRLLEMKKKLEEAAVNDNLNRMLLVFVRIEALKGELSQNSIILADFVGDTRGVEELEAEVNNLEVQKSQKKTEGTELYNQVVSKQDELKKKNGELTKEQGKFITGSRTKIAALKEEINNLKKEINDLNAKRDAVGEQIDEINKNIFVLNKKKEFIGLSNEFAEKKQAFEVSFDAWKKKFTDLGLFKEEEGKLVSGDEAKANIKELLDKINDLSFANQAKDYLLDGGDDKLAKDKESINAILGLKKALIEAGFLRDINQKLNEKRFEKKVQLDGGGSYNIYTNSFKMDLEKSYKEANDYLQRELKFVQNEGNLKYSNSLGQFINTLEMKKRKNDVSLEIGKSLDGKIDKELKNELEDFVALVLYGVGKVGELPVSLDDDRNSIYEMTFFGQSIQSNQFDTRNYYFSRSYPNGEVWKSFVDALKNAKGVGFYSEKSAQSKNTVLWILDRCREEYKRRKDEKSGKIVEVIGNLVSYVSRTR